MMTEEALEEAYASYLERQGVKAAAAERRKRQRLGMAGELGSDEGEESEEEEAGRGGFDEVPQVCAIGPIVSVCLSICLSVRPPVRLVISRLARCCEHFGLSQEAVAR
jgi:hypothetical protein